MELNHIEGDLIQQKCLIYIYRSNELDLSEAVLELLQGIKLYVL